MTGDAKLYGASGEGIKRPGHIIVKTPAGVKFRVSLVTQPEFPPRFCEVFLERRWRLGWLFLDCIRRETVAEGWEFAWELSKTLLTDDFTGENVSQARRLSDVVRED